MTPSSEGKIRVMRVIARMNVGGPAIQVCTLTAGLPLREFTQLLLVGECEKDELDYLALNGINLPLVKLRHLGRSIKVLSDFQTLLEIRSHIRKFKPHIIHTHTFKAGLLGRLASICSGIKSVRIHTFHGHLLHGYVNGLKLSILVLLESILARKSHYLVSVGEQVKDELIQNDIGKEQQFSIIPPGFDIEEHLYSGNHSLGKRTSAKESELAPFRCAWVGRMVEIKEPRRINELAREVKKKSNNIEFLVIGDGPLKTSVEAEALLENLPVSFLGWRNDVHKIISEIDLLILTSSNEGTPVSIIEAQRLGKPVIATNVGSVKEVLLHGQSGYAIPYEVGEFTNKIIELATNRPLYLTFSEKARSYSQDRFTPKRLVQDHVSLYRNAYQSHFCAHNSSMNKGQSSRS